MFIIMNASTKIPGHRSSSYRRIGIVKIIAGERPKTMNLRDRKVLAIPYTWERLHYGTTDKCAYARAMKEAEAQWRILMDKEYKEFLSLHQAGY